MNPKLSTRAAAALLIALSLACQGQTRRSPPAPVESTIISPGANPEQRAYMKNLVFADMPLEEFVRLHKANNETLEGSARLLAEADEAMRRGNKAEAKGKLRQLLSSEEETRVLLLAWNALRELGESPPPREAVEVQGVVCELHNEAGVGTLAAYRDGRIRWIGGQSKVTIWESPGADAKIDSLVRELLKSAAPVVAKAPASAKRAPGEPPLDHFRVSVLTYGGIHTVEAYGPTITMEHIPGPSLHASTLLLNALLDYEEQHPPRPQSSPPGAER